MSPLYILEIILDKLLKINKFQDYVNRKASIKCGSNISHSPQNTTIEEVFSEYKFNDIREDDIVLDIGANVGGFSLFVSKFTKHVYAVEPMLFHVIKHNVSLNRIENMTVIDAALGEGELNIPWEGFENRIIVGKSLTELIQMCGGKVDFIKTDCEGAEWCITPEELKGIRRIEAEVHEFDGTHKLEDFLKMLDKANFEYKYTSPRGGILIVHARNKIL